MKHRESGKVKTITPSEGHSHSSGAAATQLQLMTEAKQNTSVKEFGPLTTSLQSSPVVFTLKRTSASPAGPVKIDGWASFLDFLMQLFPGGAQ